MLFRPDLGPKTGHVPANVRRIGRRGRPVSLVVAVVLLAAFWVALVSLTGWGIANGRTDGPGDAVGWMAFWTAVAALILWRVWRGGRTAIAYMAAFGMMIGIVFLAATVIFAVLMVVMPAGGPALMGVAYLLPGVLAGVALLTAARLLRRPEVREWAGR